MAQNKEGLELIPDPYQHHPEAMIIYPAKVNHGSLKAIINRTVEDPTRKSMYFYRYDRSTPRIPPEMFRRARETNSRTQLINDATLLALDSREDIIFLEP